MDVLQKREPSVARVPGALDVTRSSEGKKFSSKLK